MVLGHNTIEFASIQKRDQLSENVFVLKHMLTDKSDSKLKIQVRSPGKPLYNTKFQTLQRTILDFNGTVMVLNSKKNPGQSRDNILQVFY